MKQPTDGAAEDFTGATRDGEDSSACNELPERSIEEPCHVRLHRVIRRFHNDVGSPLAALALRTELLRGKADLSPEVDALLAEFTTDLGAVIDSVRASLSELRELETIASKQH